MTSSIVLRDGVRVEYAERGDRDGVPVVMLHGLSDSYRSYDPVLAHLPASIRAIAVTTRGHGDCDRPASGYRPADLARDVADVLDVLAIERAVVVGHSAGSITARAFADAYPDRTIGVVLIGTVPTFKGNQAVDVELGAEVAPLTDPIDRGFMRAFQESTLARLIDPAYLELVVDESLKLPAATLKAALAGLVDDAVPGPAAPGLRALVIWGSEDAFCPRAEQDDVVARYDEARLSIYEGVGHAVHWEAGERVAGEIAAFAGVDVAKAAA
jgi:pimeloyl-ACP methyl ester carboxylesterase